MSQEKIKEILIALQDSEGVDSATKRQRFFQSLAEINKIVMECMPRKKRPSLNGKSFYFLGGIRGFNKAIAEFKANWEGK